MSSSAGLLRHLFLVGIAVPSASFLLWFTATLDHPVLWVEAAVLLFMGGAPILWEWHKGKFDVFNVKNAFVLYYCLQFGAYTIYLLVVGGDIHIGSVSQSYDSLRLALLYAICGLFVFQVGYYSRIGTTLGVLLPPWKVRISYGKYLIILFGLVVTGLVAFVLLAYSQGGLVFLVTHIDEIRTQKLWGLGPFFYGLNLISIAFLLSYAVALVHGHTRWLPAVLFCFSLFVSFAGAFRHMMFYTVVYALVLRHYLRASFQIRRLALIAVVVLFANVLYVTYRVGRPQELTDAPSEIAHVFERKGYTRATMDALFPRFHGTGSLARIVEKVPVVGHQWGKYFVSDLLYFPIPRALWPEKPVSSGIQFNRLFYNDIIPREETSAVVPTLLGELYWMFGLPGILAGMCFSGASCRALYCYLVANRSLATVVLYSVGFWGLVLANETLSLHSAMALMTLLTVIGLLRAVSIGQHQPAFSALPAVIHTGGGKSQ